ncbi:hypothetical protein JVT61DRAFT_7261 [Boletus reticuloceps]|uniref:Uncharacterized protein n=1 Tax=Boletus reticuloceps TaxID=495285 RepID=A0A8I2YJC9_9AGAM|nr:hypothetical protein JVT61DRAFT_7261 [Boletus reticuloceps]
MPLQHPRPHPHFPSLSPLPFSVSDSDSILVHSRPPSPPNPCSLRYHPIPPQPFTPNHRDPNTDDDNTDLDHPENDDLPGPIDPLFHNQNDHPLPQAEAPLPHDHHPGNPHPPHPHTHAAPFNVALIPDHMITDDPDHQDIVDDAIMSVLPQPIPTPSPSQHSLPSIIALALKTHSVSFSTAVVSSSQTLSFSTPMTTITSSQRWTVISSIIHYVSVPGLVLMPSFPLSPLHMITLGTSSYPSPDSSNSGLRSPQSFPSPPQVAAHPHLLARGNLACPCPKHHPRTTHHLDALGDQDHDTHCDDLRLAEDFTSLNAPTTTLLTTHTYMLVLFFTHVLSAM